MTAISTNTLNLAIAALEHEIDRTAALKAADDHEASDYGQLILDLTRALGELRDIHNQQKTQCNNE